METTPTTSRATPRFITWYQFVVVLAALAALTMYMWGPLLNAKWWIIDDYRWVRLIGHRDHLPLSETFAQFSPPDWHLGSTVNRPTYYIATAWWMFFLGKNPSLWYLVKVFCYFVGIVALWIAAKHLLGFPLAGLLTVYIGLQPMWHDIVPTGQSELYSLLGSSLFALGISMLLRPGEIKFQEPRLLSKGRLYSAAALIAVGGLVAVGSKENFTGLLLSATVILLVIGALRQQPGVLLASYALVLLWGITVLMGIYQGVLRPGVDVYGQGIGQRAAFLTQPLTFKNWAVILTIVYVVLALLYWLRPSWRVWHGIDWGTLRVALCIQSYLLFAVVFLNYFYVGNIPTGSRYCFPYAVLPALGVALLYFLISKVLGQLLPLWRKLTALGGILVAAVGILSLDISYNRRYAIQYTQATRAFDERLDKLIRLLQTNPSAPLAFQSHGFNDFEPLVAVATYLRAAGIQNPFYLNTIGYSEATATSQSEVHLLALTRGEVGPGKPFLEAKEIPPEVKSVVISFSKPALDPGVVANFWPLP